MKLFKVVIEGTTGRVWKTLTFTVSARNEIEAASSAQTSAGYFRVWGSVVSVTAC